jgi:hypothetical protein
MSDWAGTGVEVTPSGISLLTVAECRVLVRTSLTDAQLQAVIDRVEGQITNRIGAPQDDGNNVTITETLVGEGNYLFLKVAYSTIVSITEDSALLDADEYQEWPGEGMVEKLPEGCNFENTCVVVYKPADQREERKQATIELVRIYLERTAMTSENIAGEYSFTAPDWDKAIKREFKNLCFQEV